MPAAFKQEGGEVCLRSTTHEGCPCADCKRVHLPVAKYPHGVPEQFNTAAKLANMPVALQVYLATCGGCRQFSFIPPSQREGAVARIKGKGEKWKYSGASLVSAPVWLDSGSSPVVPEASSASSGNSLAPPDVYLGVPVSDGRKLPLAGFIEHKEQKIAYSRDAEPDAKWCREMLGEGAEYLSWQWSPPQRVPRALGGSPPCRAFSRSGPQRGMADAHLTDPMAVGVAQVARHLEV